MDLNDPTTAALAAADAFAAAGLAYALYGGLLTAAYGEPRETRDADFCVADVRVEEAVAALEAAGIEAREQFRDVRFGGLSISRVSLLGGEGDTGLNTLDLVRPRSERLRSAILGRALVAPLRGRDVRVVTPEDYVILKVLSTRDLDLEDAAAARRRLGPSLDPDLLEREVAHLEIELPGVPVRARFEEVVRRSAPAGGRP